MPGPLNVAESAETFRRSLGLAVARFLDGAYVYDVATATFHRVGPAAAVLLGSDDEITVDDAVDAVAAATGADRNQVAADLGAGIESLRSLGLLDRRDPYWAPTPVGGSSLDPSADPAGRGFVVHDRFLVFRSPDPTLRDRVEERLGFAAAAPGAAGGEAVAFDVVPGPDGRVVLHAAEEWDFPSREALFVQLPGVLNDFAVRSHTVAVLHAGGVITPAGRLLVVSGDAESGKSTLVGALVQQGCKYLGDELIGIDPHTLAALPYAKPLELDETSCDVLGVEAEHPPNVLPSELRRDVDLVHDAVGPVDEVILPTFQAGAQRETTRLDVEAAAKALLAQTMNMRRVREPGLRAICDLAAATPVTSIVHGDSVALAADLLT